jgi:hypothetical protein
MVSGLPVGACSAGTGVCTFFCLARCAGESWGRLLQDVDFEPGEKFRWTFLKKFCSVCLRAYLVRAACYADRHW